MQRQHAYPTDQRNRIIEIFAKHARYPRFKRRRSGGSAEYTRSAFRYDNGVLTLAKMNAPLAIRWSRPLPEGVQPSTVSVDGAGRWHVRITKLADSTRAVGVDLGIHDLVTLSTGELARRARPCDPCRKWVAIYSI